MQILKSLFITFYLTYLTIVSVYGLWEFSNEDNESMLYVALQHIIGLGFFINLFVRPVARTSALLPFWSIPMVLMAAIAFFTTMIGSSTVGVVLTVIGLTGWGGYLFWYSSYGGYTSGQIVLGQPLPDINLVSDVGTPFTNSDLLGQPSLLIFYRGNWCPLCVAQIKEVSARYQALSEMGVQVCLVSPQPEKNTQQLARRFNVPFRFLVDSDLNAAKALGIVVKNGTPTGMEVLGYDSDTVRPTVLITDKEGVLMYSDLTDNYRVRPEPDDYIAALKALMLVPH